MNLTASSKLVSVINLRKSSQPDDIEVTLLSVCVRVYMASFNVALRPAKVSTEIQWVARK